jgi:hypothetical protein
VTLNSVMHQRLTTALTAAVLAFGTLILSGCTGTPTPPDGTTTVIVTETPTSTSSGTAVSSATRTAAPPATASAQPSSRVDPSAPKGQCSDRALSVTVQNDPEGSGAGQRAAFAVFRNTGSTPCTLEGTPGVSLVGGGDGTQIGRPAARNTVGPKAITISPGHYALASIQYTYVDKNGGSFSTGSGTDPKCAAEPADGYRVYPPHSYRAFFTRSTTYACSTGVHWITVSPVMPSTISSFRPRF